MCLKRRNLHWLKCCLKRRKFLFPDDPQIVINDKTNDIIGGICQDSGVIVVVYKNELESYNPDYESFFIVRKTELSLMIS